jgi:hypothetical protein
VGAPLSPAGQTAGADAHHSAAWAWDLYVDLFGRHGPYGDGMGFSVIVHSGNVSTYVRSLAELADWLQRDDV